MNWREELALLPVEEACRRIALRQVQRAQEAWKRLDGAADGEALHDFRVALRRLRSCLRVYSAHLDGSAPRRLGRRVRELARATGVGRDLEVHIAWLTCQAGRCRGNGCAGIEWLTKRLRRRKRAADREWRSAIQAGFPRLHRRLSRRLSSYTRRIRPGRPLAEVAAGTVAGRLLCERAEDLRERLGDAEGLSDRARCHDIRISMKRLRYLLEPYAAGVEGGEGLVDRLRGLQDILGELNDARLLAAELAAALRETAGETSDALLGLVPILRARQDRALASLRAEWLGGGMEKVLQRAVAVGHALAALPGRNPEPERNGLGDGGSRAR